MDRDFGARGIALCLFLSLLLPACSSGKKSPNAAPSAPSVPAAPPADPTTVNIRVNWAANPEVDVNKAGGGYRVYYGKAPNVNTTSGTYVDVPYVAGPTAPTTALLTSLTVGTYYVKVVAYSAFNPYGIASGNASAGSTEMSISVP